MGIAIAMLLLAALSGSSSDAPALAQEDSGVDATVWANPLLVNIHTISNTLRRCGVRPVVVEVRNLAHRPITIHKEWLTVSPYNVQILGNLRLHRRVLPAKQVGLSLWVIQPTRAGDVILTASAIGVLDGEVFESTSDELILSPQRDCRARS